MWGNFPKQQIAFTKKVFTVRTLNDDDSFFLRSKHIFCKTFPFLKVKLNIHYGLG